MPKVPHDPPADLAGRDVLVHRWPTDEPLWQVANAAGAHPVRFAAMRGFGPLPTARFDPHPEPPSAGSGERVAYVAADLETALAERFQHNRLVHRADPNRPITYGWFAVRDLALLDLTGNGALMVGAAHALSGYRKDICRRWARALRAAFPTVDGLLYGSSMTGRPCAALWAPAADSFPPTPAFARALDEEADPWQDALRHACARIGYALL